MYQSPAFSDFRQLMDTWDETLYWEDVSHRIKMLLDGQNFILFFKKGDDLYGAPEESRVIFARMKNPDQDTDKDWAKDASFIAMNLSKALAGLPVQNMFGMKDLKSIKVMDRDDVEGKMMGQAKDCDCKQNRIEGHPLRFLLSKLTLLPSKLSKDVPPSMTKLKGDKK